MTYLKRYGIRLCWTVVGGLVSLILISTLYYFDLFGDGVYSFLELLVVVGDVFINCFILGKCSDKRGYLEGVKFGGVMVGVLLLTTLLSGVFRLRVLIYYFIIMVTSILGCMIGISRKKTSD